MSPSIFSRLAGSIVLITGLLLVVAQVLLVLSYDAADRVATLHDPMYLAGGIVYFVAFGGLLISLSAAYRRQEQEAGLFGLIGFAAATIGTMFMGGDLWFETFAVPWLGDVAPEAFDQVGGLLMVGGFTSYVLFAAGWALFGLASLRARVFPMAISMVIIAGGIIGFQALIPPFGLPLAVAVTSLGVWMTRGSIAGMRRTGLLVTTAFVVVGAMAAGCSLTTGTSGDGPTSTESRTTDAFSRVETGFGIGVTVTIGPAQSVEVHAQSNILPIISTKVEGGTLHIDATQEFSTTEAVEVVVVTPTLDGISLGGGSQGRVTGLAADALDISLTGGSGLTATGSASDVMLGSSGGSEAHLFDLSADTVSLELSGGATAEVNASTEVNGSASGGAHATVRGPAQLNVALSGGAEVLPE